MAWVSSQRLVDLIAELPVVIMTPTDMVPLLDSSNIVKRSDGITTTRYFQNLAGPVVSYDTRYWNGAQLVIPRTGLIDWGTGYDLSITRATEEGVSRQYASLGASPVGFDWQILGGAPDDTAITVVIGFVASRTVASSEGRSIASFEVDGDVYLGFFLERIDDVSGSMSMEFTDGADGVSFTSTVDLVDDLLAGVAIMTLDLPDNAATAMWLNEVSVPMTASPTGDWADGAPFPEHEDENAVIDQIDVYIGRDQPSRAAGQFESAFSLALFRGAPTAQDRSILQERYQPGILRA
jgi:hypothetical protein